MLNTISINLKTDIKTDRPTSLGIKLMSQDKNNNQFILRFTNGGEAVALDDSYTVEVLTKFSKSGTSRLTTAKVRQDYATWEFDTDYIAQDETVYNYVYVRKSGSLVVSADSNAFYFEVGLSEIDKDAGRVAETYDENYEKVLLDYSSALDERTTERLDEAVLDFNQRGDAEIADWREGAEIELAEKLHNFKLKNEVVNGDFSNGVTGWQCFYGNLTAINNELEVTVTSLQSSASYIGWGAGIPIISGRKYYVSTQIKPKHIKTTRFQIGNAISSPYSPPIDVYTRVSDVVTSLATINNVTGVRFIHQTDTLYAIGDKINFKNLMLIDLTNMFGVGNEPTKREMDELIKVIPNGWWDGELSLTQKQFIAWQLNLIRKNTNAIIALGGTTV